MNAINEAPPTLREAIANLAAIPDDATLFVERSGAHIDGSSKVAVFTLSDEECVQPVASVAATRAPGKEYFLESFVIAELLEGWMENHAGEAPALDEFVDCVIHYAEHDAYPEAFFGN